MPTQFSTASIARSLLRSFYLPWVGSFLFFMLVPAALFAQPASTSSGQAYPTKPVRVISPYPPGSSADIIGRIYAPRLTDTLGKQFVVDNRAGASGNIAAEIVAGRLSRVFRREWFAL